MEDLVTKTYRPHYASNGNVVQSYTYTPFTTISGDTGVLRIANYVDKKGSNRTAVARVIWD